MDAAKITKRVRVLDGLTRSDLARLSGLAPSTVGRIEDGTIDPTVTTLARILESTGFKPYGDTIVSAGDPTAVAAARAVLERQATVAGVDVATEAVASGVAAGVNGMTRWIERWVRAGWVAADPQDDNVTAIGVSAGNAAKFARRTRPRRYVEAAVLWEGLARAIGNAGFEYAVSGLVAARDKRVGTGATAPIIYVDDPDAVIHKLGLTEASPTEGVMLIAPSFDELVGTEEEGGIRFVARAQALLDAFASGGRQPEKAEAIARSWRSAPEPVTT